VRRRECVFEVLRRPLRKGHVRSATSPRPRTFRRTCEPVAAPPLTEAKTARVRTTVRPNRKRPPEFACLETPKKTMMESASLGDHAERIEANRLARQSRHRRSVFLLVAASQTPSLSLSKLGSQDRSAAVRLARSVSLPRKNRVCGLMTRVMGWKPEGRRRLFAAPCVARQPACHSLLSAEALA
jgi:hypothetical protein